MSIKRVASFFALLSVSLCIANFAGTASASAATCTWDGGGGTDTQFSNFNNWDAGCNPGPASPAGIPHDGDDIVFPSSLTSAGSVTVINNLLRTIGSMTVQDKASYSGGSLTISTAVNNGYDSNPMNAVNVDVLTIGSNSNVEFKQATPGPTPMYVVSGTTKRIILNASASLRMSIPVKLASGEVSIIGHPVGSLGSNRTDFPPTLYFDEPVDSNGTTSQISIDHAETSFYSVNPNLQNQIVVQDGTLFILLDADLGPVGPNRRLTLIHSQLEYDHDGSSEFKLPIFITGNLEGNTDVNPLYYESIRMGRNSVANSITTFSGPINVSENTFFNSETMGITLTGAISGAGTIKLTSPSHYPLIINSSANHSSTPNNTITPANYTTTVAASDNQPTLAQQVNASETLIIDGVRGDVTVYGTGYLKGHGKVNVLTLLSGGHLAPGNSPGCLSAGNTTFNSGSVFDVEIATGTVCTGYDQLKVTGTVSLGGATLNTTLLSGFLPAAGSSFTILDNDGSDAITGTFAGLAEGATFVVNGTTFKISYKGGDGNDVVLSVAAAAPKAPDTGLGLISANPLVTLAVTTTSALALLHIARSVKFA